MTNRKGQEALRRFERRQGWFRGAANYCCLGGILVPKTALKNSIVVTLLISSILAFVLLSPTLKRGLFFREDYLPYLSRVGILFALVSFLAVLRGDGIWRGDIDILLALMAGLYFLTNLWAQSKMDAMDGALKYGGYVMVFIMARYASSSPLGNRITRNLLVVTGVVVALAGYLTAAGIAQYPTSVQAGALLGSFQYPNALAAYAMFLLFFVYYAWTEGFGSALRDTIAGLVYSAISFLLVGSVFLTNSRATLLMFGGFLAVYGAILPKGHRLEILSRVAVSVISFALVASKMDTALRDNDAAGMKQGLLIGLLLAVVLELARRHLGQVVGRAALPSGQVATTSSSLGLRPTPAKVIFLRVAIIGLVVVVGSLALIAAVKNPAAETVLSRVLPPRVISQLKTITLLDRSMVIRLFATKDALSIALGYPFGTGAGGWEALYHQYHRTPYWFTETHNHFAQTLVEIGFPGLLIYVALWVALAYAAIRAYLKAHDEADEAEASASGSGGPPQGAAFATKVASSAMAVFALGIHSAMDFDLSLPAIAVAMYAAIAVLVSDVGHNLPQLLKSTVFRFTPGFPGKRSQKKGGKKPGEGLSFSLPMALTILVALALVPAVTLTANRLYSGIVYGSRAVYAHGSGDLMLGRRYLAEAAKRDKWNPSYPLELAEWAVEDYVATRNPASKNMVPLYLEAARIADPTNMERQIMEFQMLRKIGEIDDSLKAHYQLILMMPTNRSYYETFSDLGRTCIERHTKGLSNPETGEAERREHLDRLYDCAELMSSAFDILDMKRERVTGLYAKVFNPSGLNFTPRIALAAGQVAYLRGEIEASGTLLEAAAKDKNLADEAYKWLASLAEVSGYEATFPEGFASAPVEVHAMASLFGVIRPSR
jgi:O-antigen ligase